MNTDRQTDGISRLHVLHPGGEHGRRHPAVLVLATAHARATVSTLTAYLYLGANYHIMQVFNLKRIDNYHFNHREELLKVVVYL